MTNRNFTPLVDADAARKQVIRQRNVALGLVLAFIVALFFAITVVKMRHVQLPHKSPPTAAAASAAGSTNGH